ncbi:hypothetical protein [Ensifer canadensis]
MTIVIPKWLAYMFAGLMIIIAFQFVEPSSILVGFLIGLTASLIFGVTHLLFWCVEKLYHIGFRTVAKHVAKHVAIFVGGVGICFLLLAAPLLISIYFQGTLLSILVWFTPFIAMGLVIRIFGRKGREMRLKEEQERGLIHNG